MDYFGQPHVPSHLRPFKWVFDMATRRVAIPGTGDELITMTYSKDMARFVARLVEEDEWPEYSLVSGSDASLNQVVALIEKALGSKLDVARDSAEDLKAGKVTDLFGGEEMYGGLDTATTAIFLGLAVVEGKALLPKEGRLNDRFPNIKVKSIEELTAEAWIGK
jgi:dTDP-D-glucose 4,6-dehydratase